MTTRALLTPQARGQASRAGTRLYWKQLLPVGRIAYQGRTLTFDQPYLTDLARGFNEQAFDLVPAVLADEHNRHTMAPERMRGEVRKVEVRPDGLYGLVDLSTDAAALIDAHPQMGVSVRIVEDHTRADGKHWPRALQHVLLTADPRVTGMAPWQAAVDLSTDLTPVLDLSAGTYTPPSEGAPVAQLTDEEVTAFRALAAKLGDGATPTPVTPPLPQPVTPTVTPAAAPQLGDDGLPENIDDWTDAQLDAFLGTVLDDLPADPATPAVPALAGASLSNGSQPGEQARIAALELSVAQAGWRDERANFIAAGVPPVLLDKAEVLLSTPAAGAVELSNGTRLDPFQILRNVLDAAKGTVDLSAARGSSHPGEHADPESLDAVRASAAYTNWIL